MGESDPFGVKEILVEEDNVVIVLENGYKLELFIEGIGLAHGSRIISWESIVALLESAESISASRLHG